MYEGSCMVYIFKRCCKKINVKYPHINNWMVKSLIICSQSYGSPIHALKFIHAFPNYMYINYHDSY